MSREAIARSIVFVLLFAAIQIWPLAEGPFHPLTEWHVFAAAFLGAELGPTMVAEAAGVVAGDAAFVAFVMWAVLAIRRKAGGNAAAASLPEPPARSDAAPK